MTVKFKMSRDYRAIDTGSDYTDLTIFLFVIACVMIFFISQFPKFMPGQ
jgi:hypothetical protein